MVRPRSSILQLLPLGMAAILLSACQQVTTGASEAPASIEPPEPAVVEPLPEPEPEPVVVVAPEPSLQRPAVTQPVTTGVKGSSSSASATKRRSSGTGSGTASRIEVPDTTVTTSSVKRLPQPDPQPVEVVSAPEVPEPPGDGPQDSGAEPEEQEALPEDREVRSAEVAGPEPAVAIPQFPWPPPRASASAVIPAAFLRPSGVESPTLGDIADEISKALDTGGYFERSFFGAPGGFAMVTRLERINRDGTPTDEAERWTVAARLSARSVHRAVRLLPDHRVRRVLTTVRPVRDRGR
jgi:hypothetical protein